ncbi:MAG TPA: PHP domain-containing protein [Candidatus Dormibacteraeota bacterium]|nr:PHP domain-containing protein [Candidatus Dormibacteraeota bacterium]
MSVPQVGRSVPLRRARRDQRVDCRDRGERVSADAPRRIDCGPGFGVAETHAHTLASDGMVDADDLVSAAAAAGITVLCITDHDTTAALDKAVDRGAALGVEVVRGEEVTTAWPSGVHVVGLFLEGQVRMGLSVEDTVDAIHDQGGLAVLPHPFMPTYFASISARRASRLLESHRVEGIELRHTAVMAPWGWGALDDFYAAHRERLGAALGAGDSHFGSHDLGRMVTVFPGRTAADLRRAIEERTTSPRRGITPTPPPLRMRLAQQQRALLWLPRERRAGRVGGGAGRAGADA